MQTDLAIRRPAFPPTRTDTIGCVADVPLRLFEESGDCLFEGDRLHEEETTWLIGDVVHQLYFCYEDCAV